MCTPLLNLTIIIRFLLLLLLLFIFQILLGAVYYRQHTIAFHLMCVYVCDVTFCHLFYFSLPSFFDFLSFSSILQLIKKKKKTEIVAGEREHMIFSHILNHGQNEKTKRQIRAHNYATKAKSLSL